MTTRRFLAAVYLAVSFAVASVHADTAPYSVQTTSALTVESGEHVRWQAQITNTQQAPLSVHLDILVQEDSTLADAPTQDLPAQQTVSQTRRTIQIAPRATESIPLAADVVLNSGAYRLLLRLDVAGSARVDSRHVFVMPQKMAMRADSRFGINSSDMRMAPVLRRLGVGWVRFENMKWNFISPEPHVYAYDGTVKPWVVPHDRIIEAYIAQGLQVLPYLFQTAQWASSAPQDKVKRYEAYPPRDFADYGEFVYQTVARYGSTRVPEDALKTRDKRTGLNQVRTYELWNEPNLNDPGWSGWVSTFPHFLDMYRVGAEAAKKADPACKITTPGLAGIQLEVIDQLRTHRYADGKTPLDFADILNAHFYTGAVTPEIATEDTNLHRKGNGSGARTLEQDLQRLNEWRNANKPGMPIWITETGYDTGGPRAVSDRLQAAYIPRAIMLALGNGMDKVFLFRDTGSTDTLFGASGVVRNDQSYKPSFFTFATLIRQLDGMKSGRRIAHDDPNVRLYLWETDKGRLLSAWAVQGTAKLGRDMGECSVVDSFGHAMRRNVDAGMPLTEFPVYITPAKMERDFAHPDTSAPGAK